MSMIQIVLMCVNVCFQIFFFFVYSFSRCCNHNSTEEAVTVNLEAKKKFVVLSDLVLVKQSSCHRRIFFRQ